MKYKNWNKNLIRAQINKLESLYKESKDSSLLDEIEGLKNLLNDNVQIFSLPKSFYHLLKDDISSICLYYDFLSDIEDFSKLSILVHSRDIKPIDEFDNITPSLIMSFIHDFFNSLDKEFANEFNKIFRERSSNTRFTNSRSYSCYIPTFKYSYMNITKNNTVDDFLNSIHEYSHSVADRIYYRGNYSFYPFVELLPMFMELLASDYLIEHYLDFEYNVGMAKLAGLKKVIGYAKELSIESAYFADREEILSKGKVVKQISASTGKTKKYVENLFKTPAIEKFTYTIPYMVIIELYYLYKLDPEYALYLLKVLLKMDPVENYNIFLQDNGIILNEHAKDHTLKLIDSVKNTY